MRTRRKCGFLLALAFLASCETAATPAYVPMSGPIPALEMPPARAVLVVFWASWCAPCRKELPELVRLYEDPPPGLRILGFSQDDTIEAAQTFLAEIDAGRLETRVDPKGAVALEFGVRELPSAVLVANGELIARFDGPRRWSDGAMRALLSRLSAAPGESSVDSRFPAR